MNKVFLPFFLLLATFTFFKDNGICESTTPTKQATLQQNKTGKNIGTKKNSLHGYPEIKPDTVNKAIDILLIVLTDEQKQAIKNTNKAFDF